MRFISRKVRFIMALPRMRTITTAYQEIKSIDPNSALTQNQLRKMVKNGDIPHAKAGRNILINLDTLLEYLNSKSYQE